MRGILSLISMPIFVLFLYGTIQGISGILTSWQPEQHYSIDEPSTQFQLIWSRDNAFGFGKHVLAVTNENVFFLGSFNPRFIDPANTVALRKLELLSGALLQTRQLGRGPYIVTGDQDNVYVGFYSQLAIAPDALTGAAKITSYRADTITERWSQTIRGARVISSLAVDGETVIVVGSTVAADRYELLKAATGHSIYDSNTQLPLFDSGGASYIFTVEERFQEAQPRLLAIHHQTGATLWKQDVGWMYEAPSLSNDAIVGHTGENLGQAYAVDSRTGAFLWQFDDFATAMLLPTMVSLIS